MRSCTGCSLTACSGCKDQKSCLATFDPSQGKVKSVCRWDKSAEEKCKSVPYGAKSCAAIKKLSPSAKTGTYHIQDRRINGGKALEVMCDMDRDGGGWTLVQKMAGHTDMRTDNAANVHALASNNGRNINSGVTGKLSRRDIQQLCQGQYRVDQHGSRPNPLYCRFHDINQYADGHRYTGKSCATSYNEHAQYPHRGFDGTWSQGFSTWGGMTGSTIIQLKYNDGRTGSHICYDCHSSDHRCGVGGGCYVQVWCKTEG